jgi:hypothetical protein
MPMMRTRPVARKPALTRPRAVPELVRYFPIVFFQAFLTLTVLVFAFGPWDWPVDNPAQLYTFIIINQLALLFGYIWAIPGREPARFHFPLPIVQFVGICAVVSIIVLPAMTLYQAGGLIDLRTAILRPGEMYYATREAAGLRSPNPFLAYGSVILSPIFWPLPVLTAAYWKKLPFLIRLAAIVGVGLNSLSYLLIGTNKGNVDLLILIPWFLVLGSDSPEKALMPKRSLRFFALLGLAGLIFIPYFGNSIMTRGVSGMPKLKTNEGTVLAQIVEVPLVKGKLADAYSSGLIDLAAYVGQGYYGLSLSLREPFVWTYGVGHSRFFTWLAEKAVGLPKDSIGDQTYPARVQRDFGWDAGQRWSSLYSWLASDVSFFGVPIVMFFIGRIFALSWIDSLGGNPAAIVVFALLLVTLYYASANSQVAQSSITVCVFWVYLFWWLASRQFSSVPSFNIQRARAVRFRGAVR